MESSRKTSNRKVLASAILSLLFESAKAERWCTGLSKVFGREGPQKTDDQNMAIHMARLIEQDAGNFDFKFALARNVET